jgi:beta-lactamase class A
MPGINHSSRSARRRRSTRPDAQPLPPARPVPERLSASRRRRQPENPAVVKSDRFSLRRLFAFNSPPSPKNSSHDSAAPHLRLAMRERPASFPLSASRTTLPSRTAPPVSGAGRFAAAQPRSVQFDRPNAVPDSRRSRRNAAQTVRPSLVSPHAPKARKRRPRRAASPVLHIVRLLILGVGIGALAGTLLSVINPAVRQGNVAQAVQSTTTGTRSNVDVSRYAQRGVAVPIGMQLGQKMTPLVPTIQNLTTQAAGLTPGVFLVDIDTDAYLDLNGSSIFAAASMIKVPILVALLQDLDAGKVRLDEPLTMKAADVAAGSGDMQYQPVGTRYSVLETLSEMITVSDNTATNMLITRLGGAEMLNQRFREWGLTKTTIQQLLPDLEGTNTTTPKELAELLVKVNQGELLSLRSRDRMFGIMRHTVTNTLLPAGLPPEATIAHKTGDIGSMVGDTGVIDAPNGKRYIMTVMVQRPHNDDRAQELIRQISRTAYDYLSKPTASASTANTTETTLTQINTSGERSDN